MIRKAWTYAAVSLLVPGVLAVAISLAGTTMPEVTQFKAPYEHTKTTVDFTHQKHVDVHKVACGECHHNDQGKALTDLKPGDDVKTCFECHSKPGEVKGKEAKGMSKKDKLAYHGEAVHDNCIGCHRDYNKQNKKKLAPQTCNDCHPKEGSAK